MSSAEVARDETRTRSEHAKGCMTNMSAPSCFPLCSRKTIARASLTHLEASLRRHFGQLCGPCRFYTILQQGRAKRHLLRTIIHRVQWRCRSRVAVRHGRRDMLCRCLNNLYHKSGPRSWCSLLFQMRETFGFCRDLNFHDHLPELPGRRCSCS